MIKTSPLSGSPFSSQRNYSKKSGMNNFRSEFSLRFGGENKKPSAKKKGGIFSRIGEWFSGSGNSKPAVSEKSKKEEKQGWLSLIFEKATGYSAGDRYDSESESKKGKFHILKGLAFDVVAIPMLLEVVGIPGAMAVVAAHPFITRAIGAKFENGSFVNEGAIKKKVLEKLTNFPTQKLHGKIMNSVASFLGWLPPFQKAGGKDAIKSALKKPYFFISGKITELVGLKYGRRYLGDIPKGGFNKVTHFGFYFVSILWKWMIVKLFKRFGTIPRLLLRLLTKR